MRDPVPLDPTGPLLRLRVRRRTSTTVVELHGELDLTTRDAFADALNGAITASPGRRVLVDLTRCTFFAACGAEVLLDARGSTRRRRGSLDVVVGAGGPAAATIARTVRLGAGLVARPSRRVTEAACRAQPHRAGPRRTRSRDVRPDRADDDRHHRPDRPPLIR